MELVSTVSEVVFSQQGQIPMKVVSSPNQNTIRKSQIDLNFKLCGLIIMIRMIMIAILVKYLISSSTNHQPPTTNRESEFVK
jgi:hypothetical protein